MSGDNWETPIWLIMAIKDFWQKEGGIHLDPCASADARNWFARINWTECKERPGEDSLVMQWSYPTVFMNPPYSRGNLPLWTNKMIDESLRNQVAGSGRYIALVPADVGTAWFTRATDWVVRWVALKGRLTFVGAPTGARFSSALLFYGPEGDGERIEQYFERYGKVRKT